MRYEFANPLNELKSELAKETLDVKRINYNVHRLEEAAQNIERDALRERHSAEFVRENKKEDMRLIESLLDSKRAQFNVSFFLNVVMVIILSIAFLLEKIK